MVHNSTNIHKWTITSHLNFLCTKIDHDIWPDKIKCLDTEDKNKKIVSDIRPLVFTLSILQFVHIVWYDVQILGKMYSPYLLIHWRNGGLGAWNEHTFKGGLMLFIVAKQDKNDIFYIE